MIYDAAILYEPKECKGHFYRKLRLDLLKNGTIQKSITDEDFLFEVTQDTICVYDKFPTGQDMPRKRGNLILKIPMPEHFEKIVK